MIGEKWSIMSKKLDRVGETNTMFNGMEAKIIRYRNSNDLDIVFSERKG